MNRSDVAVADDADEDGLHLFDVLVPLASNFKLLVFGPLLAGAIALGVTYLIPPTFTATTVFLPPQHMRRSFQPQIQP